MTNNLKPIGVFDSGYGGLTILKDIVKVLPDYDYLYLGDTARAPYGPRSYETIYQYTLECVKWFFGQECPLVILACNTASAKALRSIQQLDLPIIAPHNRVLGVIRPTSEMVGNLTKTGSIGILGTTGTVNSQSYVIEINKFFPSVKVYQQACPMWVPLIENHEYQSVGAQYFIQEDIDNLLRQSGDIDVILLACTHYPLIADMIKKYLPSHTQLISQGSIVSNKLEDYLERHSEINERCTKGGITRFFTTDDPYDFDFHSTGFYGEKVKSNHLILR